ncbi:hypothetical protein H9660_15035 [Clostridium sp. Sa3CUN1]|uniref:Uncharacterized protein n=1 Tax=Clostridium gallinarum TaxID=2762246 RepID=A0ABR8Q7P7_9CLOT|nr:hypothetical protein [Clostridium gallinarum]MBD7916457.1 hypothetical protein [Clostridium gallinarum]
MKLQARTVLFYGIISLIIFEAFNSFGLRNSVFKLLKYLITLIVFLICANDIKNDLKEKKSLDYIFELKRIAIVLVVFFSISIFKVYQVKVFTYKTIEELMQLTIPFVYTFFIINFMSLEDIMKLMKYVLGLSLIAYVLSIGLDKFTIANFLSISFFNSYSPFESADFAEISSSLSAFFIYYRKKSPKAAIISFIFCFLVFKRMLLLQLFVLAFISILNLSDKKVNNIVMWGTKFFFIISTFFFYFLLKQENSWLFNKYTGMDIGDFTMGRVYRLWYPLKEYVSYGFGSTSNVLGHNLELDLIKILIEIGVIGLIIFICCYLDLARNNFYSFVIMGGIFGNLLFASCLTSTVGWIFRLICIAAIFYKRDELNCNEDENTEYIGNEYI